MKLSDCEKIAFESCRGFWIGFAVPSVCMVAAKIWIMANGSQKTVTEISQRIGTAEARRIMAVGVFAITFIFAILQTVRVPIVISGALSLAFGYALRNRMTYTGYRCIQVPVIITSLGLSILKFKKQKDKGAQNKDALLSLGKSWISG